MSIKFYFFLNLIGFDKFFFKKNKNFYKILKNFNFLKLLNINFLYLNKKLKILNLFFLKNFNINYFNGEYFYKFLKFFFFFKKKKYISYVYQLKRIKNLRCYKNYFLKINFYKSFINFLSFNNFSICKNLFLINRFCKIKYILNKLIINKPLLLKEVFIFKNE